jgi:GTP-binding protein
MINLSKKPLVAILGRPNVGKSTLFNRLIGRKKAIVHETSGITRDRIEDLVTWGEYEFIVADLAGWEEKLDSPFEDEVKEVIDDTISRAQLIVLMVDGRSGLLSQDAVLAKKVRRLKKPAILCVNKIDHPDMEKYQGEFLGLGFDATLMISAMHSRSVNDLLDMIVERLDFSDTTDAPESTDVINLALIGRQNVGKSSLFNFLLGNKRSIVSAIPGTTRDSIDAFFSYEDKRYAIVDTAGLKKQAKTTEDIEYYSSVRAKRSLERAEIALFMLDVQDDISDTDLKIANVIQESKRAVIILGNKWDLTKKDTPQNRAEFEKHIRKKFHFFEYAPIVFTSGLEGSGIKDLMKAVSLVHDNYNMRITTSELNRILKEAYDYRPPQSYKGRAPKILYSHQVACAPPTFQFFVNDPAIFHANYRRYLERKIRSVFGFDGAPMVIYYKERKRTSAMHKKSDKEDDSDNQS